MQCGWSDESVLVMLMPAKEISQVAFNVFSMVSASLMYSADGSVAIVLVVNINAIVKMCGISWDCICSFVPFSWTVLKGEAFFGLSILGLVIVLKSVWLKMFIANAIFAPIRLDAAGVSASIERVNTMLDHWYKDGFGISKNFVKFCIPVKFIVWFN